MGRRTVRWGRPERLKVWGVWVVGIRSIRAWDAAVAEGGEGGLVGGVFSGGKEARGGEDGPDPTEP